MSEPAKSARSPALEGPKFECLVNPHQYERILKRRAARERYANERGFKVKYANGRLNLHPRRAKAGRRAEKAKLAKAALRAGEGAAAGALRASEGEPEARAEKKVESEPV